MGGNFLERISTAEHSCSGSVDKTRRMQGVSRTIHNFDCGNSKCTECGVDKRLSLSPNGAALGPNLPATGNIAVALVGEDRQQDGGSRLTEQLR